MPARVRAEILQHLVADLESFELDDAEELIALFPDLALLQF